MNDDPVIPITFTELGNDIVLSAKSMADYSSGLAFDHVHVFAQMRANNTGKDVYVYGVSVDGSDDTTYLFAVSPKETTP